MRRIDCQWNNPKLKNLNKPLVDKCERTTCNGRGLPFVNNTKELLEGRLPKSFDLIQVQNIQFKRFDLIPDTSRQIKSQILSNDHVYQADLDYLESKRSKPLAYSDKPYGNNYCLPPGF